MPSSSSSSSSSVLPVATTRNVWVEREEARKQAADLFLTAVTDSSSSSSSCQEVLDQAKSPPSPVLRVFLFLFFQLLYRLESQTDLAHFHLHASECLRYLRLLIASSPVSSSDQDACTVKAYPSSSSSQDEEESRRRERERKRIRDALVKMLSLESLLLFCLFSSLACALEASRGCRRMQRTISEVLHPGRVKERTSQKEKEEGGRDEEECYRKPNDKKKDKKYGHAPEKETKEEEEREDEEEEKGRNRERSCTGVDRRNVKEKNKEMEEAYTWKERKERFSSRENLPSSSSFHTDDSNSKAGGGGEEKARERIDSKKQRKGNEDKVGREKKEEEQQPPPKSLTVAVYRHVPLSLARVSDLAEVVWEGYSKRENLSSSSPTSQNSALEADEKNEVGEGEEKREDEEEKEEKNTKAKKRKKKKKKKEEDDGSQQEEEEEEGCSLVVLLAFQLCCDMSTCLVDEAYSIVRTFRRNERSGHLGKLAACLSFLRVEEEGSGEKEKTQEKEEELKTRKTTDNSKMKTEKKKKNKKNEELYKKTEEQRADFSTSEEEEEDQDENLLIMAAILLGPVCQFLMLLRAHQGKDHHQHYVLVQHACTRTSR